MAWWATPLAVVALAVAAIVFVRRHRDKAARQAIRDAIGQGAAALLTAFGAVSILFVAGVPLGARVAIAAMLALATVALAWSVVGNLRDALRSKSHEALVDSGHADRIRIACREMSRNLRARYAPVYGAQPTNNPRLKEMFDAHFPDVAALVAEYERVSSDCSTAAQVTRARLYKAMRDAGFDQQPYDWACIEWLLWDALSKYANGVAPHFEMFDDWYHDPGGSLHLQLHGDGLVFVHTSEIGVSVAVSLGQPIADLAREMFTWDEPHAWLQCNGQKMKAGLDVATRCEELFDRRGYEERAECPLCRVE